MKKSIFWFRRDLRLEDNIGLFQALKQSTTVQPIFIFDESILNELPQDDARVSFIYDNLFLINKTLKANGSSLLILKGKPEDVWNQLVEKHNIESVFFNKDYEPYARKRDERVIQLLSKNNIKCSVFKDSVIHEENDILKKDGTPYTVYTPYKKKWLEHYTTKEVLPPISFDNFDQSNHQFPSLEKIGFKKSSIQVKDFKLSHLSSYGETRNFPELDSTSYLGPHLRFGTVSVRQVIAQSKNSRDEVFLSELIWREFFTQILFHFPKVVTHNFRSKYDGIKWRNNEQDFEKWCNGNTGYPMVDAGMRQLNETGYMHNRVRMVTASFLIKHLLIDWKWGEAYFAKKLLDFELASNNGNWQWSAGTGCDAAPYFRIFNPIEQLKKFDKNQVYIKQWIPELLSGNYTLPMVEHKMARLRALDTYKEGIE
ncbi:DNA photolyase family protein [bacterium]|nr:DNA photolyase family protein [bacterium]MDB4088278.1 DNA photolyase family protein [Flavobacteriales bacterium]